MTILSNYLSRNPALGYLASAGSGGVSALSLLQHGTVLLAFLGALFGFLGAVLTFLIQWRNWRKGR